MSTEMFRAMPQQYRPGSEYTNMLITLTDIHYNNIRPNLLDVFITDHIIRLVAKPSVYFIIPGHNQFENLHGTFIELEIRHFPKFLAIFQIYDFFFLKIRKQHNIPDILVFLLLNAGTGKWFHVNLFMLPLFH
mgnify:CR=1 FL=1